MFVGLYIPKEETKKPKKEIIKDNAESLFEEEKPKAKKK